MCVCVKLSYLEAISKTAAITNTTELVIKATNVNIAGE